MFGWVVKGCAASSYPFLSIPRWQVVQRSTLGVPVKMTSSWRFAVMIWLTFREGLARSRIGRLRTIEGMTPGWIFRSLSWSRVFSANSSRCAFSASRRVFSRSVTLPRAASRSAITFSSWRR